MLDLKAAFRALRRAPAFTAGAVVTLAVALGLVTTALGLLAGALAGDRSARDRVVLYLTEVDAGRPMRMRWPYPAVEVLRANATSFDRIATYTSSRLNARIEDDAFRLAAEFVSPDYFAIVSVGPALGRLPSHASTTGGALEIAISDGAWRRWFATSPSVIGREVRITRQPFTIVGVMPPGFRGLSERADVWLPHTLSPQLSNADYLTSTEYFHTVVAQLKTGVTLTQARSELAVIAARISSAVPPRSEQAVNRGADVVPLDDARRSATTVRARGLAAIGSLLVLLIAAVNIATLVAARIAGRQREYAIRLAIGAGRARVFRVVAMEIGLVMAAGLGAAALAALWARDVIANVLPQMMATPANDYGQLASFAGVRLDPIVLLVVGAVSVVTTIAIAIPGCRRILRDELTELLKRAGAGLGQRPGISLQALVTVQVAASLALLVSAGLVFRTILAMSTVNPGFNPDNVIAFSVNEDLAVQQPASGPALVERLLTAVKTARGVEAATVDQAAPFSPFGARLGLIIEGRPEMVEQPAPVGWHRVGPDHFNTLGIPVLRGRGFSADDRRGRMPVVVINQTAAERFFAGMDPIGRRIRLPAVLPGEAEVAEIVGVVGNVVYWPPDEPAGADVYQPALQFAYPFTTVMVRAAGDPAQVIAAVRQAVRTVDPNLPLFDIVTLSDLAANGRADRRFLLILLAICAVLGLLLSAIGVFAVTASWLEARRRELGMRVALGAKPAALVRMVMATTLRQAVLGICVGAALALAAGRALDATLFGVAPHDPATLAGAGLAMLMVSAVAAYVPARRALRLDPVREINCE